MEVELVEILVGKGLAVHLLYALGEQTAVQTDKTALWQFADERRNILMLYIGIGIELRPCGRIVGIHIIGEELHLLHSLTVFGVFLTVNDETFCHFKVSLTHQCLLNLILDIFNGDVVMDIKMRQDFGDGSEVGRLFHTVERLEDSVHNLVERELLSRSIALGNGEVLDFHVSFKLFFCD